VSLFLSLIIINYPQMNKQSLIIFNIPVLFKILNEIKVSFNFELFEFRNLNDLENLTESKYGNYLIVTNTKIPDHLNLRSIYLTESPSKIKDIVEKFNIHLLKNKFVNQSEVKINKFQLDLNSRKISFNNKSLKLTEREIDIILYLNKSSNSQTIENLQKEVWGHGVTLETHTVETHIYRLRKKINEAFNNNEFIISTEDGYKLS
tara:strand:+ start:248 stop:862 length:615 start_codon:yes stop_codon:yes gene_type:complete